MIEYVKGDLFDNIPKGNVLIPHIVNDIGAWGSGFVIPLGEKFPEAKKRYLHRDKQCYQSLGRCQFVLCKLEMDRGVTVANMCAQTGIMGHSTGDRAKVNSKPIRYAALVKCLEKVEGYCKVSKDCKHPVDILAPKFGSDRAGGNWDFIEELIEEIVVSAKSITIFEL